MDVLSSRILLRPSDLDRSRRFYRDLLGLAIYREFGPPEDPGLVFYLGQGLLEVSGHAAGPPGRSVMIWIQVRDVHAEHPRLAAAGVPIVREPVAEPRGAIEMWIEDPTASGSSWSRFPPVTHSAVTCGRCYRRDGQQDAAQQRGPLKHGSPAPVRNAACADAYRAAMAGPAWRPAWPACWTVVVMSPAADEDLLAR